MESISSPIKTGWVIVGDGNSCSAGFSGAGAEVGIGGSEIGTIGNGVGAGSGSASSVTTSGMAGDIGSGGGATGDNINPLLSTLNSPLGLGTGLYSNGGTIREGLALAINGIPL